jgi:hypothetical protein
MKDFNVILKKLTSMKIEISLLIILSFFLLIFIVELICKNYFFIAFIHYVNKLFIYFENNF